MTIGSRIKRRRLALDMTLEDVSKIVGVTRATIQKYENGIISNIPSDKIELLAKALLTSPAYIMGWDDGMPAGASTMPGTVQRPRLGRIACGKPILADDNIECYDDVPDWIRCDYTLLCKGDSMINARIYDGDIVCVRAADQAADGSIAVVLIDGEYDAEATLKRIRIFPDHIVLEAENPLYRPLVYWHEDMNRVHVKGVATHFISTIK